MTPRNLHERLSRSQRIAQPSRALAHPSPALARIILHGKTPGFAGGLPKSDNSGSRLHRRLLLAFDFHRLRSGPFEGPAIVKPPALPGVLGQMHEPVVPVTVVCLDEEQGEVRSSASFGQVAVHATLDVKTPIRFVLLDVVDRAATQDVRDAYSFEGLSCGWRVAGVGEEGTDSEGKEHFCLWQ